MAPASSSSTAKLILVLFVVAASSSQTAHAARLLLDLLLPLEARNDGAEAPSSALSSGSKLLVVPGGDPIQEDDGHGDSRYFDYSAELQAPVASPLPSPTDSAAAATTGRPFGAAAGLVVALWRKLWRFDEPYGHYRAVPAIRGGVGIWTPR